MDLEELKNAKHDIVDVAEAGSLGLLGVVEAAGPIEGNIGVGAIELDGGANGAAGGGLAEAEEAVEDGAVLADVEALEVAGEGDLGEGLGGDVGEEVDVVLGVEAADVHGGGREGAVDLHAAVEAVVHDQVVRHSDSVRLHGVPLPVVVVPDRRLVEVAHPPLPPVRPRRQRRPSLTLRLHARWLLLLQIPNSTSLSLSLSR